MGKITNLPEFMSIFRTLKVKILFWVKAPYKSQKRTAWPTIPVKEP